MNAKKIAVHTLRWIATPFVYLITVCMGYYLGRIIFHLNYTDLGLVYIKNTTAQSYITDFGNLVAHIIGTGIAMWIAGAVAPSHKIGVARTLGAIHAAIVTAILVLCIAVGTDVPLYDIAGSIGILLGIAITWHTVNKIF